MDGSGGGGKDGGDSRYVNSSILFWLNCFALSLRTSCSGSSGIVGSIRVTPRSSCNLLGPAIVRTTSSDVMQHDIYLSRSSSAEHPSPEETCLSTHFPVRQTLELSPSHVPLSTPSQASVSVDPKIHSTFLRFESPLLALQFSPSFPLARCPKHSAPAHDCATPSARTASPL